MIVTRTTSQQSALALTALAASALFAANFMLHRWDPFAHSRLAYYLVVVLGFGAGLTLGVMSRLDTSLLPTGFNCPRPRLALFTAVMAGGALLLVSAGPVIVADPRRALNLFVWLWMTSVVEVLMFLGLIYNVTRVVAQRFMPTWPAIMLAAALSCMLFGAYHFTYSPPWNTLRLAGTVAVVWIFVTVVFVVGDSLWAAIVFNNCAAIVGFLRNAISELDAEPMALGIVLDVLLVAVIAAGLARVFPASSFAGRPPRA